MLKEIGHMPKVGEAIGLAELVAFSDQEKLKRSPLGKLKKYFLFGYLLGVIFWSFSVYWIFNAINFMEQVI